MGKADCEYPLCYPHKIKYHRDMRIWGKIFKENRLCLDCVVEDYSEATRTAKVFDSLEKLCNEFDLAMPVWLESNINDFRRDARVRFFQDSFLEEIDFDFLEFHVIEED